MDPLPSRYPFTHPDGWRSRTAYGWGLMKERAGPRLCRNVASQSFLFFFSKGSLILERVEKFVYILYLSSLFHTFATVWEKMANTCNWSPHEYTKSAAAILTQCVYNSSSKLQHGW